MNIGPLPFDRLEAVMAEKMIQIPIKGFLIDDGLAPFHLTILRHLRILMPKLAGVTSFDSFGINKDGTFNCHPLNTEESSVRETLLVLGLGSTVSARVIANALIYDKQPIMYVGVEDGKSFSYALEHKDLPASEESAGMYRTSANITENQASRAKHVDHGMGFRGVELIAA
jgi:hypothetical protein